MSSDTTRKQPDVPFLPAGPGLAETFACAQCGGHKPMTGRRLQVVRKGSMRGLRAWVCCDCKEQAK